MSVSTQIERLQADKIKIKNKLVELGLAEGTENLSALADVVAGVIDRGAVQVEIVEGTSYQIPAGYHNGSGTVSALTDVTGEAEKYKKQAKGPVIPTKEQQSVTPDEGYYALSSVTVGAIPAAYQDVTAVTATDANVLVGKIFVDKNGSIIAGTMADNGAADKTLDCTAVTYTIPAGYHNGNGKVTITLEEKTVVPSKTAQTVSPSDGKVLSKVTVAAITDNFVDTTDATATEDQLLSGQTAYTYETNSSGIKAGKKITGTMANNGAVEVILTPADREYTVLQGYHNGSGKVSAAITSVTVNPTKEAQRINDHANFFANVYVNPIPDKYQDITAVTASKYEVLSGYDFVDNTGELVSGAIVNRGFVEAAIDGLTTTKVAFNSGYYTSAYVSLTDDIEKALAAI